MTGRLLFASLVVAGLTLGAASSEVRQRRLEVAGAGGVVWSQAVLPGDTFDVSFVHSQERTRWIQHYRVAGDGAIRQTGSTFGSYGAGMPIGPVRLTKGGFEAPVDRRLPSIRMLSSKAAELTLVFAGRRMALDRWFQDYAAFEIRIR